MSAAVSQQRLSMMYLEAGDLQAAQDNIDEALFLVEEVLDDQTEPNDPASVISTLRDWDHKLLEHGLLSAPDSQQVALKQSLKRLYIDALKANIAESLRYVSAIVEFNKQWANAVKYLMRAKILLEENEYQEDAHIIKAEAMVMFDLFRVFSGMGRRTEAEELCRQAINKAVFFVSPKAVTKKNQHRWLQYVVMSPSSRGWSCYSLLSNELAQDMDVLVAHLLFFLAESRTDYTDAHLLEPKVKASIAECAKARFAFFDQPKKKKPSRTSTVYASGDPSRHRLLLYFDAAYIMMLQYGHESQIFLQRLLRCGEVALELNLYDVAAVILGSMMRFQRVSVCWCVLQPFPLNDVSITAVSRNTSKHLLKHSLLRTFRNIHV